MADHQLVTVLRKLCKQAETRRNAPSDRELLDRFLASREETAFAVLFERHGGLVLNVCRRLLPNSQDAEDVCQAVFLVLARKAAGIRRRDSLAAWLHGTAYRLACNLRRHLARRQKRERPLVDMVATNDSDASWREVRGVLDEELRRLPEKLRLPLLLCYLEGKTRDEAARCLGWSVGTLRGRLERGRDLLRGRLTRRGLDLSAALLATLLTENVRSAALPPERVALICGAALAYVKGVTREAVSVQAVALAEGMVRAMFLAKVNVVAACVALGLLLLGGGVMMRAAPWAGPASGVALTPREAGERGEAEKQKDKADASRAVETKPKSAWRSRGDVKGLNALDVPHFSADGKTMIALDQATNSVQLRDARTGELQKSIAVKKMKLRSGFAVSADGGTVAVRGATYHGYFVANRLAVIDVRSGEEVQVVANDLRTDKVFDKAAYPQHLALSPDGKRVAWTTEFEQGRMLLGDRATNKIWELPNYHSWHPGMAFTPDGKTLVIAAEGSILHFLDAAEGKEIGTAHAGVSFDEMSFLPDGKSLALAKIEQQSDYELEWSRPVVTILDLHKRQVSKEHRAKTSISNWDIHLLSASLAANLWVIENVREASLIVWDLVSGEKEILLRGEKFYAATISPDGTTLAVVRRSADEKTMGVLSLWRRGGK